jgi:hypothetical protein
VTGELADIACDSAETFLSNGVLTMAEGLEAIDDFQAGQRRTE